MEAPDFTGCGKKFDWKLNNIIENCHPERFRSDEGSDEESKDPDGAVITMLPDNVFTSMVQTRAYGLMKSISVAELVFFGCISWHNRHVRYILVKVHYHGMGVAWILGSLDSSSLAGPDFARDDSWCLL